MRSYLCMQLLLLGEFSLRLRHKPDAARSCTRSATHYERSTNSQNKGSIRFAAAAVCICTVCCSGRHLRQIADHTGVPAGDLHSLDYDITGRVTKGSPATISLSELQTRAERTYTWAVTTTADKDAITLQADGSVQQIG
jgi:hypothetical protein